MKKQIVQEYYVLERDGKLYGEICPDGRSSYTLFIPIEEQKSRYFVYTPLEKVKKIGEFSKELIDKEGLGVLTYESNKEHFLNEEIKGARLRKIKVTTVIEFID